MKRGRLVLREKGGDGGIDDIALVARAFAGARGRESKHRGFCQTRRLLLLSSDSVKTLQPTVSTHSI